MKYDLSSLHEISYWLASKARDKRLYQAADNGIEGIIDGAKGLGTMFGGAPALAVSPELRQSTSNSIGSSINNIKNAYQNIKKANNIDNMIQKRIEDANKRTKERNLSNQTQSYIAQNNIEKAFGADAPSIFGNGVIQSLNNRVLNRGIYPQDIKAQIALKNLMAGKLF